MKKDIHPQWYPDAKVIVNGEHVMSIGSTQPELNVEIWSGTHPFYTGQQRLVDTEGQVDRFIKRLQKRQEVVKQEEEAAAAEAAASPLAMSIKKLALGTRAENALAEAGLNTVSDLLTRYQDGGDDALLAVSGVGQKALIDIKKYLRSVELI